MPTVPTFTGVSDGDLMRVGDLYQSPGTGGLWAPGDKTTFEVLHGGLDADNLQGKIGAELLQPGSLACGSRVSFGVTQYLYASQMPDGSDDGGQSLSHLSAEFFLPWDASLVIVGIQVFAQADATLWEASGTPREEHWSLYALFDGSAYDAGFKQTLPPTRGTVDTAGTAGSNDPGYSSEARWRWASGHRWFQSVARGKHIIKVGATCRVYGSDPYNAKLAQPTGAIVWLALR